VRDEAEHKADGEAEGDTALPPVVDAVWVTEHLGEDGLLLADVRGPNAHIRGHLPGSIPLVLGSPAPVTDRAVLEELAKRPGRVLTHSHLLRTIWGPAHEQQTEYLRVVVRGLRQKLEAEPSKPQLLINEPGIGYRLLATRE